MHKNQKLCTWYLIIIMTCVALSAGVFLVMNKIERVATRLETRIYRRDLSAIVDQDYALDKKQHSDKPIEFLNALTDFFYNFHENTVDYKRQLETFMTKRGHIVHRFNNSNVKVFDLTVVTHRRAEDYELRQHLVPVNSDPRLVLKQLPFSRQLKFRNKDARRLASNMLFACTARLAVSSLQIATLNVNFVSSEEPVNVQEFMEYRIVKTAVNITMNRIIRMNRPKNFRIVVKGFSNKLVKLHKVEAYCVNFNDVSDEEVSKFK